MSENRKEETRNERRRRDTKTLNNVSQKKLDVFIPGQLNTNDFEYHWANDVGNRITSLTKLDDWDIVTPTEVEDFNANMFDQSESGRIQKLVGVDKGGNPIHSVLLRKPKNYALEDAEAMVKERRAQTDQRMRGEVVEGVSDTKGMYVTPNNTAHAPGTSRRSGKV